MMLLRQNALSDPFKALRTTKIKVLFVLSLLLLLFYIFLLAHVGFSSVEHLFKD